MPLTLDVFSSDRVLMFRRIEFIEQTNKKTRLPWDKGDRSWKHGLMGVWMNGECCDMAMDAISALDAPNVMRNCRFYFTEKGWDEMGRKIVHACKKTGQRFRIITIKEKSVDVVARDKFQVAVRPRKKCK